MLKLFRERNARKNTVYITVYMGANEGTFGYLDALIWQYDGQHEWKKNTASNLMDKQFLKILNYSSHG